VPDHPLPNPLTSAQHLLRCLWLPEDWCELNVAVALSGGADSISLLRALWQHKTKHGGAGQVIALHVDHQLRGEESAADARWCQQACDAWGITLKVLTCDTAHSAAESGMGLEAAARMQRYQLLTTAAEQAGVRYLATAHTEDDQVETVLFRILRGTGLRGLGGIPRTRILTPSLTLIRPLLGCSRQLVTGYLAELGQTYRTDSSNTDDQFTRNSLRHELLPLLRKKYNPQLSVALLRLATQASQTQQLLEQQALDLLDRSQLAIQARSLSLCWQAFARQDRGIVCEALRIAWREAGLAEQAMTHAWWLRLADLALATQESQVLNLPGKVRASITGDLLLLQW